MYSAVALNLMAGSLTMAEVTVRLHSSDPGAAGTTNEVSGANGLERGTIPTNGWMAAAAGTRSNVADIECGTTTADAGTIAWFSLWHGNTFLARRALAAAVQAPMGRVVTIAAGTVTIAVTSP